jgi:hypothetical protein
VTAEPKLPTRRLAPAVVEAIKGLTPGDRIRVTQTVRVGAKTWSVPAVGSFRGLRYLATGVTTERVAEDDIVVPTMHFTKDNGELSSVCLDENTKVEKL